MAFEAFSFEAFYCSEHRATLDSYSITLIFHHEGLGSDVVKRADIWMIECGYGFRFTVQTLREVLFGEFNRD